MVFNEREKSESNRKLVFQQTYSFFINYFTCFPYFVNEFSFFTNYPFDTGWRFPIDENQLSILVFGNHYKKFNSTTSLQKYSFKKETKILRDVFV